MNETDTSREAVEQRAAILEKSAASRRSFGWENIANEDATAAATLRALLTRCETAERERDEARASINALAAKIHAASPRLPDGHEYDFLALPDYVDGVVARAEAAEAREAVMREALQKCTRIGSPGLPYRTRQAAFAALTSTVEAAAARDARLREEGRREGIEEAARVADTIAEQIEKRDQFKVLEMQTLGQDAAERIAAAIRALLDTPAKGGADE